MKQQGVAANLKDAENWTMVIRPKTSFLQLNLAELFHYRDLIGLLVRRNLASVYKQTVLGWLWFIIQPLFTTAMYVIVFGNIARMGTDGIPQPLFYFSGTILWTFFAVNLTQSSETFTANSGLFGKIYFPRFTMPIAYVVTNAISLGVQFAFLLVFYAYYLFSGYGFSPSPWLLAVPLLLLQLGVLGTGIGLTISALTTKYRDLKQLVTFGMTLWMYATPIVYPLSKVPERWRWAYVLNPVSPVIETFRFALLGRGSIDISAIGVSIGVTLTMLFLGIVIFNYAERTFIDVV